MAEKFRFFDPVMDENGNYDREYNANEFTEYFSALVTTGVMKGAGNQLTVTADNASMVTTLDTGIAFVSGKYYENDAPLQHIHDTETVGKQRIDRIVIRKDENANSRYVRSFIKKGVASTTPIPPALTQNDTVYEISVAQVRVVGGQTFIRSENVIDERGTDVICPWAGSRILPNFDDSTIGQPGGIAQLNEEGKVVDADGNLVEGKVKSVNGQIGDIDLHLLTDGPHLKAFPWSDLNDAKEAGFYNVNLNSVQNAPSGRVGNWILEVLSTKNGNAVQTLRNSYGLFSFVQRGYIASNGAWTAWETYYTPRINLETEPILLGTNAKGGGISIGRNTTSADVIHSVSIGYQSFAEFAAIAIGLNPTADGGNSIAIGQNASALNNNECALGSNVQNWKIPGSLSVAGTKNFEIPHPHPNKRNTHRIRHGAVESPTTGDTLYRYSIEATADGQIVELQLPDYFEHLNTNVDVWVNPHKHFGRAFGEVIGDKLFATCEKVGEYKVLVIGTRNDENVQDWYIKGVEREIGESWLGETYVFSVDEIVEVEEIKEVIA